MASSFGTTNIRVQRGDRGSYPVPTFLSYGRTDHVSEGGDITQSTGVGSETVGYRLWLTTAEYTALKASARAQEVSALTVADEAMGNHQLESFTDPLRFGGGRYEVSVTFRKVTTV